MHKQKNSLLDLKAEWKHMCETIGATANLNRILNSLIIDYSLNSLPYHNIDHVVACLKEFKPVKSLLKDPGSVEFAIWFHDIVYNPASIDNEERSADIAQSAAIDMGLDTEFANKVHALVLSTKPDADAAGEDSKYLIDIDISIFGKDSAVFDEYDRNIKKEYSFVNDNDYREGRASVLRSFLNRQSIFKTQYFASRYEKKTRENLNKALARLHTRQ